MSSLRYWEKQAIAQFFEFEGGYIFNFARQKMCYNKNDTQAIILDACSIDIYTDPDYSGLSQEQCVMKILDEGDDRTVAKLLSNMLDKYYLLVKKPLENQQNFDTIKNMVDRLFKTNSILLPSLDGNAAEKIKDDIQHQLESGTPEMAVDRLHSFISRFIIGIMKKHNLPTADQKDEQYSLPSMYGSLRDFYKREHIYNSDFCEKAVKAAFGIIECFNDLRNNSTPAHTGELLTKTDAEFILSISCDTIHYIEKIEKGIPTT